MAADYKPWLDDHQITHILTISEGTNPTYPEVYIYICYDNVFILLRRNY
jgi:type IV secretory pathway ATPase VirB11/archaellum biosynthesis ATPase